MLLLALTFAFQEAEEVDAAIARFRAAFNGAKSAVDRMTAIQELGRVPHDKTLAVLAPLVTVGEGLVRQAAIQSIGGFHDQRKKAGPILLKSLQTNQSEPNAVAAALQALGKLGDAGALPVVHKFFRDKNAFVARAAVGAAGNLPHASSIDPLIELLKDQEKALANAGSGGVGPVIPSPTGGSIKPDAGIRKDAETLAALANASLARITTQDLKTSAAWAAWWSENRGTFKAGP